MLDGSSAPTILLAATLLIRPSGPTVVDNGFDVQAPYTATCTVSGLTLGITYELTNTVSSLSGDRFPVVGFCVVRGGSALRPHR